MKLKLLFALLIVQLGFAQQRQCGTDEYMNQLMADPVQRQQYLDLQQQFQAELQRLTALRNDGTLLNSPAATIRIPVAVHYSGAASASATLRTCLRTLAQRQVAILNADYNATNADLSTWTNSASSAFPGIDYGVMDVSWEIATQNHPAGTGLANGDLAVTFGTDFLGTTGTDTTWNGYCNLVVRDINYAPYPAGTLGYSPLGGNPGSGATVVIDNNAFGAAMPASPGPTSCAGYAPQPGYNLGRTLTHELGHFFSLYHTFQGCDGSNCATSGDMVCDTPEANDPEYGCVAPGNRPSGCGGTQLTMNYMDYPSDACMYMFTAGQATRMMAWYNVIDQNLATNVLGSNEFVTHNFSISPNPNNGTFAINLKEQSDKFTVLVLDAMGRVVYDNEFNQTIDLSQTIQLNSAETGLYFVTIEANGESVTKKIMVK